MAELEDIVSSSNIAVTVTPVAPLNDARVDNPVTDTVPVMLVSVNNSMLPVPLAFNSKFALVTFVVMGGVCISICNNKPYCVLKEYTIE